MTTVPSSTENVERHTCNRCGHEYTAWEADNNRNGARSGVRFDCPKCGLTKRLG